MMEAASEAKAWGGARNAAAAITFRPPPLADIQAVSVRDATTPRAARDRTTSRRKLVEITARELGSPAAESPQALSRLHDRVEQLEEDGHDFDTAEASFRLLLLKALGERAGCCEIEWYRVITERHGGKLVSEASVKVRARGQCFHTVAEGDGPLAAMARAFCSALESAYPLVRSIKLVGHVVSTLSVAGGEAGRNPTRVVVRATDGRTAWSTVGVNDDPIEAGWMALRDMIEYRLLAC